MTKQQKTVWRRRRAMGAFSLALISCLLGLFFCLAKSPQAKSDGYLAAAQTAMADDDNHRALQMAYEAVRLNPVSAKGWMLLESLLQQKGQSEAALQASMIAHRLQQNPGAESPLAAIPAELRLSLLTLAGGAHP